MYNYLLKLYFSDNLHLDYWAKFIKINVYEQINFQINLTVLLKILVTYTFFKHKA